MKKLLFFAVIAASYYIAGMYRQLPLMIFAVMEWVLLLFLLFLSRHLRKNLSLSLPAQNDEAEKDTVKKCYIRIVRDGRLPLKKVRLQLRLYNDNDVLLLKKSISQTINAASGIMEFSFCPSQCGILRIQICRMFVYDYLSLFFAAKPAETEFSIVVFPSARPLPLLPPSGENAADWQQELPPQSQIKYFGSESRDIRQIREYRMGDTLRYVHWNQSAKTEKLWFKEFEPEEDPFVELLLDLMLPEDWQDERRDGFYEMTAALVLGLLQSGHPLHVCWYVSQTAGFITLPVTDIPEYRSMMRRLYQSDFVEKTDAAVIAYEKQQSGADVGFFKCNLLLECYAVSGQYGEELRHQFTYENSKRKLSRNPIFSLR